MLLEDSLHPKGNDECRLSEMRIVSCCMWLWFVEAPGAMPRSILCVLLLCLLPITFAQMPGGKYVRIDCGGTQNLTNSVNQTWESDRFYSGGFRANVSQPEHFPRQQERTLRYFPTSQGKKNCYEVDVPIGRHLIQMFFAYDNYDNMSHSPSFDVSVEGTVVFSWRNPWLDTAANFGAYSDLYAFIHDGSATICFYSIATDAPVIGALELLQVDDLSYGSNSTGQNVILANYGRLTGGNGSFGPGFDNIIDLGGRSWEADDRYTSSPKAVLITPQNIRLANLAPNYWPVRLYQECRVTPLPVPLIYTFEVDGKLDYQLWFHFAEIDARITAAGQRVFNVYVNGVVVLPLLDIFQQVGSYSAFDFVYTVRNLTGGSLVIALNPLVGKPIMCGMEVLAMLQADSATNSTEAVAMHFLKTAMNIPERMGWNGDPCSPTVWDAWEGVTCNLGSDGTSLVVTHMNIAGEHLTGILSAEFTQLTHLITLNVSNNNLTGNIPDGLGLNSLVALDVSSNALTGSIPLSLGSPQMQHLRLDNNQLYGQVPEAIYTIGVHGGFINLSSNVGLCGVPSLPNCPHAWNEGGSSIGATIGIVIGCSVFTLVVGLGVLLYIQRKGSQEDYNFNLPRQLVERTKWYQQHKMTKGAEAEGVSMIQTALPNRFGFSTNIAQHQ